MNVISQSSKPIKLGFRYFKKENVLQYKPDEFLGLTFICFDSYKLFMYRSVEINRGTPFPFKLKVLKVYDSRTQIWKIPSRIISDTVEVSPRWFLNKAVLIQCDEQGN